MYYMYFLHKVDCHLTNDLKYIRICFFGEQSHNNGRRQPWKPLSWIPIGRQLIAVIELYGQSLLEINKLRRQSFKNSIKSLSLF